MNDSDLLIKMYFRVPYIIVAIILPTIISQVVFLEYYAVGDLDSLFFCLNTIKDPESQLK